MTLSLCLICKNERNNLPRLLKSVEGCFDEIHITDTGSTDGTLEWIAEHAKTNPNVFLHHFTWVDDFAAARNYSFSHAKTDYAMWLDCDDVLDGRDQFIEWKRSLMPTHNYWLATYHYALDKEGNPLCSFMRERVIRTDMGYQWMHFVHEGIPPKPTSGAPKISYATSWCVKHLRTEEDLKVDRNRNLSMFDKNKHQMNSRMLYYYGKELFEAGKPMEAYTQLVNASKLEDLELHDRILCIQYACMAAMQCNQFNEAIQLAHCGLQLSPNRAEFLVIIGDCYIKMQQYDNAIPNFVAAASCQNQNPASSVFHSPIFTNADAYGHYPRNQLARLFFHRGNIQACKKWLEEALLLGPNVETGALYAEVLKVEQTLEVKAPGKVPVIDEYVITCPQQTPYLWDEEIAKTRGIGGSETAAVQVARWLHKLTGKTVRIFNERAAKLDCNGVVYHPLSELKPYFSNGEPIAHIAWRHNTKFTHAPTYLWCHDLAVPGIETPNYTAVLSLSPFHKEYLKHIFKVPQDKIQLIRNGIDPMRFIGKSFEVKNPNKIVFSSSPDRGLDRAIGVVERARAISGKELELHCFYGFDNLIKMGHHAEVARIQALINQRPWVKFHGNLQQDRLVDHLTDAKAWIYPTDFLETFCITALEMLACRVRPVVRAWGALPYTLAGEPATILDRDCFDDLDVNEWAKALLASLEIDQPSVDIERFSWEAVAKSWLEWLPQSK